ncbi:PD-(D/E)XK nuclease family protein [Liquorilactobacillus mali]|uniref:PD-(D/E)XK nuclease family protein n=1 Tax=Liquorilactobacillus mali TaxID=1618 RepID=UPI0023508963|nr:PD-(D/E)XK nuclease family protein [Liquorilactobacillus mali]MDC7953662.1 PD-(D/E)XK nuclease family protein [Liquorilactobacillus mali]
MSLSFILGSAAKDHQNDLVEQVIRLKKEKTVKKIYILVPNHIKFASEIAILQKLRAAFGQDGEVFAQSSVQILSFSRLAWFFLKDSAIYQKTRLSSAGLNMLVLSILEEQKNNLTIFKGEQAQSGFVSEVVAQLDEFSKGQINSQDLAFFAEQTNNQSDLYAKLKDLQIIYQEYEKKLVGKYLDNNQLLQALTKKLAKTNLVDSCFMVTGFSQLTAGENKLVETLVKNAKEVYVDLILDEHQKEANPRKNSLYYRSNKLYTNLVAYAKQNQINVKNVTAAGNRVKTPVLLDLEGYWIGMVKRPTELKSEDISKGLSVFSANNRYLEIEEVATRIRHSVVNEGYRYSDFIILTRHLDLYRNVITPVFTQYHLPFFIDLQKKMTDHPFVEFIMALFAVKKHYYRYDDLMRLLKTELLLPKVDGRSITSKEYREYLDLTENLVLKFGFEGKSWLREDDWIYYRFFEGDTGTQTDKEVEISRKVNVIRHLIKTTLPPFFEKIKKAENGREAAQILCSFLTKAGIPDELINWRDRALEQGKIEEAAKPEETWTTFCNLLDEYVELLGEHKFDEDQFVEILQTGFEGAEYSQVPSTLDQIIVSESGMVQMNDRKITFLIGATDAVMPDKINGHSIISDEDRSYLNPALNAEQYLNDDTLNQLAAEPFLGYLAFMSSSDKLYLSYPLADDGKEKLRPSPYVTRIADHYRIKLDSKIREPQIMDTTEYVLKHYVGTKKTTIKKLLKILRQAKIQELQIPKIWVEIHNFLNEDGQETEFMNKILASLSYQNIPEKLKPELVDLLYGKTINTSISKLEEFYANEYAYFLKYGLKLQERSIFELSAANTGEFFHLAMDSLAKMLKAENIRLPEISVEELQEKIRIITEQIRQLPQFQILNSTQRMQYLSRQLDATVVQVAKALQKQQVRSNAQIMQTEVLFGHVGAENGIAPLEFKLGNGRKVNVRGKIDRIDQISVGDTDYVGIVDYKSSSHVFDFRDAYYGLALQMLTYLDTLMLNFDKIANNERTKPAGALYMHLFNPKLRAKDLLKQSKEELWLKANKYDGLIISDENLLQAMDEKLAEESNGYSSLYPFRKKKDGSFKASGRHQLVTLAELELLLRHNENLIKEAANKILSGELSLNPVQWPNKRTALQFSPYKSIFQFDAMLPENHYRKLPKITPEEVIKILMEDAGETNGKI